MAKGQVSTDLAYLFLLQREHLCKKNKIITTSLDITDLRFCDSQDLSLRRETITFPVVLVVLYS